MIRCSIQNQPRKLKGVITGCGSGPSERIEYLRRRVTALIRHERIEGREDYIDETRGYAEQLISLAIQHGDKHKPTMEMADAWLLQKDLVHKLFKVLAPRYEQYSTSLTRTYRLPAKYPGNGRYNAVLELKGNPYPPVLPHQRETHHLLSNVLLSSASKDFYKQKHQAALSDTESSAEKSYNKSDISSTEGSQISSTEGSQISSTEGSQISSTEGSQMQESDDITEGSVERKNHISNKNVTT